MRVLNKFRDVKSNLITFEELKEFEIGKIEDINPVKKGGVLCERLHNKGANLMFRVEMLKGERWELHFHDCTEKLLVYKGALKDELTNNIANNSKILSFKPYKEHLVVALVDTIFYVEFQLVD